MRRWTCNRRPAMLTCGGAVLIAGLTIVCYGQADPPADDRESPPRLLLLFDGRVIIGDIAEVPGGYSVQRAEGSIVVPFDFVRLTATTLLDAYQKQRDNLEDPNAEQHLNLARWCFQHQLREQAVLELEAALKLEPFRREARELLQLIEAVQSAQTPGAETDLPMTGPDQLTSGGISSDNHLEFVRRIQPLLVNKCGNATCHGSASTNGLRLHNVRTGRRHQRTLSDENLAITLRFVDADFPLHSPLLRAPQDPENPVHRGVFAGALGSQQVELLSNWIHAAAVDRQLAGRTETAPFEGDSVIQQAGMSQPSTSDPPGPRIINIPRDAADPRSPRSSEVLSDILDEERPDAFDPEAFNRRVHGGQR